MTSRNQYAAVLLLMGLLIASACSAIPGADAEASVIGVSSEYYSPTGNYTMQVWYYSDNTTKFVFDYSGEESSSEIGHAVRMTVSEGSTVKGTLYPVSMDEVMWVDSLPASLLATGKYTIAVYNPSDGLIVRCTLIVGSLSTITINNPDEGSISPPGGEYVVPTGSVLSRVGDNLVIKYGDSVLYTFVPTAPSEEMQLSAWWVNGTELTSDWPITSDLTISLTWETVSVTITFNANGGSGSMGPYSVPRNSSYTLPSNSFTPPSGKRFSYWDIDGTRYNVGSTVVVDSDLTVKAMWYTPSPPGPEPSYYNYTLRFDANGGEGAPDTIMETSSSLSYTFTIPSKVPTRSGYEFQGWGDTGTTPVYQPGSKITLTSYLPTKTLFAVWKETAIPDVKDFSMDVDVISMPEGSSVKMPYTVDPPEAAPGIVWTSSDETVVIVEDGIVTTVGTGDAVITAYDSHGNKLGSISIHVAPSTEKKVEETTYTSDGGAVILVYDLDDAGEMIPSNPVTIVPGTSHMVTEDQLDIVLPFIDALQQAGRNPHVIIPTDSPVTVPSELLAAIVNGHGSLTIIEGDVTLYFPWEVLEAIGYGEDLEFVIIPIEVEESESVDIDVSGLDNVKVYDIYVLKNGVKVAITFPTAVTVTIDYPMKEGWTPDRLSVWYLDVDPRQTVEFEYVKGEGVVFGVMHFSHYAVSYDEGKTPADDCCVWCWILILAAVILIIFLIWFFLWKRFKLTLTNERGTIVSVPEGWKRESDSSISIRMRRKQEIVIPEIEAESPEGSHGMRIIGWNPSPPEKITRSTELRAVWSDGPVEMIGPQSDQE
jgi:uncharacterized repeat protein (TIGR02543 family)